ncbi:MAG: DUF2309 domain-containing protein [Fuerstiella sp.]
MPSPSVHEEEDFDTELPASTSTADAKNATCLSSVLTEIQSIVPPLWPLRDYVAVNPFLGLSSKSFLDARQLLCSVRNCDLLMSRSYFQSLLEDNAIAQADIAEALQQCRREYPDQYSDLEAADVIDWINGAASMVDSERTVQTVSETLDQQLGSTWTSHIINDISRYLSAHYDEGQASWQSPWKSLSLYEAWRQSSMISRRMEQLGIGDFRSFVGDLQTSATEAIAQMLRLLEVPRSDWRSFLMCEVFAVSGWASYVRFRGWNPGAPHQDNEDLIGLLAIRLAYDVALLRCHDLTWPSTSWPSITEESDAAPTNVLALPMDVAARYCLQVAAEVAYRRKLCTDLLDNVPSTNNPPENAGAGSAETVKQLQMVFCIDVRSEVFRRNLESVDQGVETFGFAGFFGMPFEYVPLGADAGAAQCPVLLSPGFKVKETIRGTDDATCLQATKARDILRLTRKRWKSFQSSATSCFSFVESMGLFYAAKLLTDSLRLTRTGSGSDLDGVAKHQHGQLGPDLNAKDSLTSADSALNVDQKLTLAENMLRNLGLTHSFARIVTICGHASEVTNNPYKAGLDCGACGGHSGESNARVAAALLNDAEVRTGLVARGIHVPHETWFVAAVHNTTTDQIRFLDTDLLPAAFAADFSRIKEWTEEAGRLSRTERSTRLGSSSEADVFRRSCDWSEVRPEWGLAGNAAFIVAPRARTAGMNLTGRTFMHSYDYRQDTDLKVLELIMTAPMVVTNWINLQYYASAVDNRSFGSGNKLIHNVVGRLGVLEGNGGDLMTGLPWQSVHDGQRYQHEPLRLLVLIEAPRESVQQILEKHPHVCDLVTNGWLSLMVREESAFYRWTSEKAWQADNSATSLAS